MVNVDWCHECGEPECRKSCLQCEHYRRKHGLPPLKEAVQQKGQRSDDLAPAHRAAVEVMASGIKKTPNLWFNGSGDMPWKVCCWDNDSETSITLGAFDTEPEAVAFRDQQILEFRATAALRALIEAGFWVARWEPIETAPKDGTEVVTARSRSYGQDVSTDWYAVDPMSTERGWLIGTTHWTPLPPPPPEARDAE